MKVEKFAEKMVRMAAEEKMTVAEFRKALYIAKWITNNSAVEERSAWCGGYDMASSDSRSI